MDETVVTAGNHDRSAEPISPAVEFEAFFQEHHERLFRGLWMVCELLHNMLGMRHGDHAIDLYVRVQRGIHQHPLEHWSW